MSTAITATDAPDAASSGTRRISSRVRRQTERFVPEASPAGSAKRKRGAESDGGAGAEGHASDESPEESSEGEPDEEELRERRRKKPAKTKAKKPAAKKPKTNGETLSLAIRPATVKPKKPRKVPIRKSAVVDEAEGLYADVFAHGNSVEDVAAQWVAEFEENEGNAVADLVTFVLRAAGCTTNITADDAGDPDNAQARLSEIQDDYTAQNITEYPLISKAREAAAFKKALHGFFVALIQILDQKGLLYAPLLLENIQVWIGSMTSASNRPIRHTSTVACLAMTTAFSMIARGVVESTAKKIRQSETESKKARVNKGRVAAVNKEVEQLNQKLQELNASIEDGLDTVYIHRYRDVDWKIRLECAEAMAEWILTYPDKFFDAHNLRYLGWILSDQQHQVRLEVLRGLQRLFRDKDKLGGLKTFTERFRPRIIEMASFDAEVTVRTTVIDLLDMLRDAGFLEPDDIDAVGKLIFDAEPRVRKAVVEFFAENVNSAYDLQVEDMGGQEALDEGLNAPETDEDYDKPRLEWLKLKCLVEQLLAYDADDEDLPSQIERIPSGGAELRLVANGVETRFSLAAQALFDAIPEIKAWEVIAGYLLYDHSQNEQNGTGEDVEVMLRQNCKLSDREEIALLHILNAAVNLRLARIAEGVHDKRKTKAQRDAEKEEQAETTKKLSVLIPQLLKKFGATPEAAALCLRLQRELNLDVFHEMRQDAALVALLDDINKQFLTHHNEDVLIEAREALLHALGHEESREITELKFQGNWDELINAFDALRRGHDLSTPGNLSPPDVVALSYIVLKLSEQAKLSDASILENIPKPPAKSKGKGRRDAANATPPILSLLQILDRGVSTADLDEETEIAETKLVHHTMELLFCYFLWKIRFCTEHIEAGTAIDDDALTAIAERRDTCMVGLMKIMQRRKGADDTRVEAANVLLDIYNFFYSLKSIKTALGDKSKKKPQARGQQASNDDWEVLCQEIDEPTTKVLLQILTALETNLAKRTKKQLEEAEADVDDEPIDPDDEPEDSDDEEEVDEKLYEEKQKRALQAEIQLCTFGGRIVRAVHAGTLDGKSMGSKTVRQRMERNKAKLGHNWKEVVAHLELVGGVKRGAKKTKGGAKETVKAAAAAKKSTEIVVEDESEEEHEHEQEEVEEHMDEDGDEEMADVDAEHVNGEAEENGALEKSPEVESVLGD
ncbi:hypothetical protein P154DRAFT_502063 [Amniculicola lignicola CBS 123094]|uniref:SCD domain-containing protein n=1 Tax=Amniculicola lignicola CBS 123094 TaxID=1392246 RepID=A0A6A5VZB6_9PLEO|nr:hypothetical protein P154DRAFT_502063 [Amniculicola lignicola CBS 123094]